jgi:hypothetical protein
MILQPPTFQQPDENPYNNNNPPIQIETQENEEDYKE